MNPAASLVLALALLAPPDAGGRTNYPDEWVAAALADAKQGTPTTTRYVVARSTDERAAVAFILNSVVSRSAVTYRPRVVGPSLVAFDFVSLSANDADVKEIATLWASLAADEFYFHEHRVAAVAVAPFKATDGKTYSTKTVALAIPASRLGAPLVELEKLTGNVTPATASSVPIVRGDWLVSKLSQTINGGRYYDFRRLKLGTTTLDAYLESRGASRKAAEKLQADERSGLLSRVTAKPRSVQIYQTIGTRPSAGPGYAAITEDPFDESVDVRADAFRQLLDLQADGREVMVATANGWIEWTLWDAAGKLVKEAPGNLVRDNRIPSPHTDRLNGLISCVRCHGENSGWQSIDNEVLTGGQNVLGDVKLSATLAAKYGADPADLAGVVDLARDAFAKNVFIATRLPAKEACAAVARVFGAYEYEAISLTSAAAEVGLTAEAFPQRVAVQPIDDPIIARLFVERLDLQAGKKVRLQITRRQFERVYDNLSRRIK